MKKIILFTLLILLIPTFAVCQGPFVKPFWGVLEGSAPSAMSNVVIIYANSSNQLKAIDEDGNEYSVFMDDPNITFTIGDLLTIGRGTKTDQTLLLDGNAQDFYVAIDDTTDDLTIGTGSTVGSNVKMVVENGGNVGIGTITPGALLNVAGGADASGTFYLYADRGDDYNDKWCFVAQTDGTLDIINVAESNNGEVITLEYDGDIQLSPNGGNTISAGSITATSGIYADASNTYGITAAGALTAGTITGKTESRILTNCEGTHDGDPNATIMTDSGEAFTTDAYIGMTLYNTTDNSSCTITDNDGTTMTGTLSGGTDNNWDVGDTWAVAPGPYQSGMIWYITSSTTILHPATAYYVASYFAGAAVTVKIDPQSASMTINFSDDGVYTDPGAGDEIDGDGTQGDFITIHNASTTEAYSWEVNGSWSDGGSS